MLYVCQGETYVTTNDEENIIIESEEISTDIMKVISNVDICNYINDPYLYCKYTRIEV